MEFGEILIGLVRTGYFALMASISYWSWRTIRKMRAERRIRRKVDELLGTTLQATTVIPNGFTYEQVAQIATVSDLPFDRARAQLDTRLYNMQQQISSVLQALDIRIPAEQVMLDPPPPPAPVPEPPREPSATQQPRERNVELD